MRRVYLTAFLALIACRDFSLPQGPSGALSVASVQADPTILPAGATVVVTVTASAALEACSATLGSSLGSCPTPEGASCSCTITAAADQPEGPASIQVSVTGQGLTAAASTEVEIDTTPPQLQPANVALLRGAIGTADRVALNGPVADDDGGLLYAGRGVRTVRFASRQGLETQVLATAEPGPAGTLPAELVLTGTEERSFPTLWLSAVDRAGNETSWTRVQSGEDTSGPQVDADRLRHARRPVGERDSVTAEAGAFSDPAGVVEALLYETAHGIEPVARIEVDAAGGFAEQPVGTAEQSFSGLWVAGIDKAGNAGERVLVGRVDGRYDLQGRVRWDGAFGSLALHACALDLDPRTAAPGLAAVVCSEADAATTAAAARVDAERAHTSATPDERDVAASWTLVDAAPVLPARLEHAMAYDPQGRKTVLFGGAGDPDALGDLWAWDGAGWTELLLERTPSRRHGHAVVTDALRGRLVLVGGRDWWTYLGRTYELAGEAWETGYDDPGDRDGHAMAYDAARGRVVVFGGMCLNDKLGDTWEYDGERWEERTFAVAPPPRRHASMAYDAVRGRVVLFGGYDENGAGYLSDTWEYDGDRWVETTPAAGPSGRLGHELVFDARRGRVVLFGGDLGDAPFASAETWEYDGRAWAEVPVPGAPARRDHALAYDPDRGTVLMMGGVDADMFQADTWRYERREPHARQAAHVFLLRLDPAASASRLSVSWTGAARGGGAASWGAELLVWDWADGRWVALGAHAASDADAAADRTLTATPPGEAARYVGGGLLWLMATSAARSAEPPGTAPSEVWTDGIEVSVETTVP